MSRELQRLRDAAAVLRTLTGDKPNTPAQGVFAAVADYLDHVASVRAYSARIPTEHAHRIADAILDQKGQRQ